MHGVDLFTQWQHFRILGISPDEFRGNPFRMLFFLHNFAVENSENRLHLSKKQAFCVRFALSLPSKTSENR
jgi:hypothetical protein